MAFRDRIRSIFRRPADPVPAPVPVDRAGVADRRAGALIGVHAGDSLGATFEFNRVGPATIPADQLDVTGGGAFGWNAGDATDDTDLTRAVLHAHLAATEDPDLDIVRVAADNMAAWKAHGPRDIGGATASGLNHYARTGDPRDAGAGQGSAGNGSLMRTIPTAVFVDDPDDRARLSREISAVTHDDLTCQAACVAYNDTVAAVIAGRPVTEAINDATRITTSSVFGDAASSCRNCGEPTELDDSGDRVHTTNSSRICESYRDQYDEEDGDDIDYRHEAGVLDERYDEAVEQVRQAVDAGRSLDLSEVAATGRFPDGYPYSPGGGHVLHSLAVAVAAAEDDRGHPPTVAGQAPVRNRVHGRRCGGGSRPMGTDRRGHPLHARRSRPTGHPAGRFERDVRSGNPLLRPSLHEHHHPRFGALPSPPLTVLALQARSATKAAE